jgi:cytidine deaminase
MSTLLLPELEAQLLSEAWLPAHEVARCLAGDASQSAQLLIDVLPLAKQLARAPVSGFQVGAAVLGQQDPHEGASALYLGANLEFAGLGLAATVHAEQAACNQAWLRGETGITSLAASAAPCGHCRQFLCELGSPETLAIMAHGEEPATLDQLLPLAFIPAALGVQQAWMNKPATAPQAEASLQDLASAAARASHAPYSNGDAGVALEFEDGHRVTGRLVESVAFNPSLPPLASALSYLVLTEGKRSWDQIRRCVLAEAPAKCSQAAASEAMLGVVAPQAQFERVLLGQI